MQVISQLWSMLWANPCDHSEMARYHVDNKPPQLYMAWVLYFMNTSAKNQQTELRLSPSMQHVDLFQDLHTSVAEVMYWHAAAGRCDHNELQTSVQFDSGRVAWVWWDWHLLAGKNTHKKPDLKVDRTATAYGEMYKRLLNAAGVSIKAKNVLTHLSRESAMSKVGKKRHFLEMPTPAPCLPDA
jgi:hypothetical protein